MLFAFGGLGEAVLGIALLFGGFAWAMGKLAKKTDPDGKIKKATTDGIVKMLGRWLK
jgi:hypothetical protein